MQAGRPWKRTPEDSTQIAQANRSKHESKRRRAKSGGTARKGVRHTGEAQEQGPTQESHGTKEAVPDPRAGVNAGAVPGPARPGRHVCRKGNGARAPTTAVGAGRPAVSRGGRKN